MDPQYDYPYIDQGVLAQGFEAAISDPATFMSLRPTGAGPGGMVYNYRRQQMLGGYGAASGGAGELALPDVSFEDAWLGTSKMPTGRMPVAQPFIDPYERTGSALAPGTAPRRPSLPPSAAPPAATAPDPWVNANMLGSGPIGSHPKAKEEERKSDLDERTKAALCKEPLRSFYIPLDPKGQQQKYPGISFSYYLRRIGGADAQDAARAQTELVELLKRNPPSQYVPRDPFYKTCGRYEPDKELEVYTQWAKECAKDPGCKKRREEAGQKCKAARDALPETDPRGTKWEALAGKMTPEQRDRDLERLKDLPALEECQGMFEQWKELGSNPRLWLTGVVEGAPRYGSGPKAGEIMYARDVHSLPVDRECRFRDGITFTPEFVQANFYNEDGSPRSYEELLTERVITRDMLFCPKVYGPQAPCTLKKDQLPDIAADVLDKYLKDENGNWRKRDDGTRLTFRDIVPQLVHDGVLSRDQVDCPGERSPVNDAAGTVFTITAPGPATPPPTPETPASIHVEGSPVPFYGSFRPHGEDAIFAPPSSQTPASLVGGVRAFPAHVAPRPRSTPLNLSEEDRPEGASSIFDFMVSFREGSETWPALP